jgi:hypothetical protein
MNFVQNLFKKQKKKDESKIFRYSNYKYICNYCGIDKVNRYYRFDRSFLRTIYCLK